MSDDVALALREIAALLKARNDQSAEVSKRAQENLAQFRVPIPEMPDFAALEAKQEAEAQERRELAARHREEDVAFRERLLAAIERQNALLARLVERLGADRTDD